jgi:hypothetical protein
MTKDERYTIDENDSKIAKDEDKSSRVETLRTPPTSNDVGIRAGDIL